MLPPHGRGAVPVPAGRRLDGGGRPEQDGVLRAWIAYRNGECSLCFWRTKAGLEVDFVLYGEATFLAIEVKRSRTVSGKGIRPALAFLEDYPQTTACLLYGGRERLKVNNIRCLPCGECLRYLRPDAPALPG